jgi:hypothetical protein
MRTLRLAFLVVMALRVTMAAQDNADIEVFGGYSLERINPSEHPSGAAISRPHPLAPSSISTAGMPR